MEAPFNARIMRAFLAKKERKNVDIHTFVRLVQESCIHLF